MRAGTQTLIQALQAIPWADYPDHDDDIGQQDSAPADSDSEEENKPRKCYFLCHARVSHIKSSSEGRLASSIHTIYRPLARSRRAESILAVSHAEGFARVSEEEPDSEETVSDSDDDAEEVEEPAQIFEETTPRPPDAPRLAHVQHAMGGSRQLGQSLRPSVARSGTMATVRIQRRARLAQKLKEIFDLDGIDDVWAGAYACVNILALFSHNCRNPMLASPLCL